MLVRGFWENSSGDLWEVRREKDDYFGYCWVITDMMGIVVNAFFIQEPLRKWLAGCTFTQIRIGGKGND